MSQDLISTQLCEPSHEILSLDKPVAWSILLTCEHASNRLPPGYPQWVWGPSDISKDLPNMHWAVDVGARLLLEDIMIALYKENERLPNPTAPGIIQTVAARFSRLLLDPNRPLTSDTLIRLQCDEEDVDLNKNLTKEEIELRTNLLYNPFHSAITEIIKEKKVKMVFSIHSFNPIYEGNVRELEVGVLFDIEDEIGSIVTESLVKDGIKAVENEPYSGKQNLMYSPVSHREEIQYENPLALELEVRNDLLADKQMRTKIATSLAKALNHPKIVPRAVIM